MASNKVEEKVQNLLENTIINLGYELYDVIYEKEGKDYYLRIFIDKENGISINDCEYVNNNINNILDEANYIKDAYYLEVSSPGLERVLRKDKHFISQIGKEIYIKLYSQVEKKKELIGILEDYNDNEIIINKNNKSIKLDKKNIAIAKTVFNF